MDQTKELIQTYTTEIIMILLASFFLLLVLYLIAEVRISRLKKRYDVLVRNSDGINIEELLLKNGREIEKMSNNILQQSGRLDILETRLDSAIQKIGFVRYNAFADMGSELSFSIAFLDNLSNGFVLSSIYGRENSTCYAKPIENGKSIYPLSAEEIQAIDRAIREQE